MNNKKIYLLGEITRLKEEINKLKEQNYYSKLDIKANNSIIDFCERTVKAINKRLWLMDLITSGMADDSGLKKHMLESAAHMRLLTMGLILLLVLRFSPRGLIPEN